MADSAEHETAWYRSPRGGALCAGVLLLGLSLVLFVNLGAEPVTRLSEKRVMTVVAAMVRSGDWMVPRVQGTPRLQKPPLLYWVGAANAKLLDDPGPLPVRLPSALAALALVGVVLAWGTSLGGIARGLAAAAALAAMYQLIVSGRRGDAEMLLALFCTASLFAFDRLHATRSRALLPVFGLLAGLALLAKTTAVFPVVALPILVYLAVQRELRLLRDPGMLAACALALAIGVAWYVVIALTVEGALATFWDELIHPLSWAFDDSPSIRHARPFWFYLGALPLRAAPASVLLPVVIWRLYTTRVYRDAPRMRFAAICFLATFAAFSLLRQKQVHYVLVMLPSLALLCAESVVALAPRARAWLARLVGAPLALAGLAATALLALYFHWVEARSVSLVAAASLAIGGLFAWALIAALRGRAPWVALAWLPAFLLVLTLHRAVAIVRVELLESDGVGGMTLDERERLYRLAREQPWFIDLFQQARGKGGDG